MGIGPKLEGERIRLRGLMPEKDAKQWFEVMQDPEMHLWTGNTVPQNIEEVQELLQNYNEHKDIIAWAVADKTTDEIVGTYWICKPMVEDEKVIIHSEAQRIAKKCWRKGYTKEARCLVYQYAFYELKAAEIHAGAWANNANSCSSMEKARFVLLETTKKRFDKYDEIFDENHYVLYKEAWMR